jgi:phospholipase C
MLENRSFDHLIGFLRSPTYQINGLNGNETNSDSTGKPITVDTTADYSGDFTPDPGHDHKDVVVQLFGSAEAEEAHPPDMSGFVKSYENKTHNPGKAARIMKCFAPSKIPIVSRLAQEYAVCDNWFSSLPGPTLPNRSFIHAATSIGRLDMTPLWLNETRTVYELLQDNGVDAKIFYHDSTMAMTFRRLMKNQNKFFGLFDDFLRACKNNTLPPYSFIEPRYFSTNTEGANDQHPDHDVSLGETLIEDVYKAISGNPDLWASTLFCICYDEHGGLYDHVPPPKTVNPDGMNCTKPPFDFTRLGVRTPAILISPFIAQGTIDSTLYDHTSVIATARKLFLADPVNNFLTLRDKQANSFEGILNLTTARTPIADLRAPMPGSPHALMAMRPVFRKPDNSAGKKLTDWQKMQLKQVREMEKTLPPQQQTGTPISTLKTEREAAAYIKKVNARIRAAKHLGGGSVGKTRPAKKVAKKSAVKVTTRGVAAKKVATKKSASVKVAAKTKAKVVARKAVKKTVQKAKTKISKKRGGK